MLKIPSVQHQHVEDGYGTHVLNSRLLLRVLERAPAKDEQRSRIENGADDNEKQRIVAKNDGFTHIVGFEVSRNEG